MNDPMTDAERAELRDFANRSGPLPVSLMPAAVLALLDDRDRLAAEVSRLRTDLERAAYAFHSAHLGWEGGCCCPAHKIAADALATRKEGP